MLQPRRSRMIRIWFQRWTFAASECEQRHSVARPRDDAGYGRAEEGGASTASFIALPGQLVLDHVSEVQMLFWRIHAPIQHAKEKRGEARKREGPGDDLPK